MSPIRPLTDESSETVDWRVEGDYWLMSQVRLLTDESSETSDWWVEEDHWDEPSEKTGILRVVDQWLLMLRSYFDLAGDPGSWLVGLQCDKMILEHRSIGGRIAEEGEVEPSRSSSLFAVN